MTATTSGPLASGRDATPSPSLTAGSETGSGRTYGRVIGALFLAGFFTYGAGYALVNSVVADSDMLSSVSTQRTTLMLGAFLMLLTTAVDIGKAVLFFPILNKLGKRTALTYLAAMIFEVALMAVGALLLLSLVPLAEQLQAGDIDAELAGSLGALALDTNTIAYQIGQAALAFGAVFLCALLYRTRLIPRGLAALGVLGYVMHFAGASAELFGVHISLFLLIPGMVFEVSFGVWLLIKGLDTEPPAQAS
jgi:hypothetical protein